MSGWLLRGLAALLLMMVSSIGISRLAGQLFGLDEFLVIRSDENGWTQEMWMMDRDGNLTRRFPAVFAYNNPGWTPDGLQLLREAGNSLTIAYTRGQQKREIAASYLDWRWTADGRHVVSGTMEGLYITVRSTGNQTQRVADSILRFDLTQDEAGVVYLAPDGVHISKSVDAARQTVTDSAISQPLWIDDDRAVLYVDTVADRRQLHITQFDNGETVVIHTAEQIGLPGDRDVFIPDQRKRQIGVRTEREHLLILDVAIRQINYQSPVATYYGSEQWSPNGDILMYLSSPERHPYLVRMGQEQATVRTDIRADDIPLWSPDSRAIALTTRDDRVLVLDTALNTIWQSDHSIERVNRLAWSPDSCCLRYDVIQPRTGDYQRDIYLLDLSTGVSRNLTADSDLAFTSGAWRPR